MNKQKMLSIILVILIIATLVFIWGNSLKTVPESSKESTQVLTNTKPALESIVGKKNATDHLVRKIAHFVEYCVLGGEFALLLLLFRRVGIQGVSNCLFAGLSTAVIDESLQIISKRGSMVSDVLLDLGGVAAGILIILLLHLISKPKSKKSSLIQASEH